MQAGGAAERCTQSKDLISVEEEEEEEEEEVRISDRKRVQTDKATIVLVSLERRCEVKSSTEPD